MLVALSGIMIIALVYVLINLRNAKNHTRDLRSKLHYLCDQAKTIHENSGYTPTKRAGAIRELLQEQIGNAADFNYFAMSLRYLKNNHIFEAGDHLTIAADLAHPDFFAAIPDLKWKANFFVVLGILGTFVGFTLFLYNIPDLNKGVNPAMQSLNAGIGGLKTAFVTSILGVLFLFGLYRLIIRKIERIADQGYRELCDSYASHILPALVEKRTETMLQTVAESIEHSTSQFSITVEQLAENAKIIESTADVISGVSRHFEESISLFRDAVRSQKEEIAGLTTLIHELRGEFSANSTALASLLDVHQRNQKMQEKSLAVFLDISDNMGKMPSIFEKINEMVAERDIKLLETIDAQRDQFQEFSISFTGQLKGVTDQMIKHGEANREEYAKIGEVLHSTLESDNAALQKAAGQLEELLAGNIKTIDKMNNEMRELREEILRTPEADSAQQQLLTEQLAALNDVLADLKSGNAALVRALKQSGPAASSARPPRKTPAPARRPAAPATRSESRQRTDVYAPQPEKEKAPPPPVAAERPPVPTGGLRGFFSKFKK